MIAVVRVCRVARLGTLLCQLEVTQQLEECVAAGHPVAKEHALGHQPELVIADAWNTKWQNVYKHSEAFYEGKCTFGEIDVDLCNKFKEYLYTALQTIHKKQRLHTNTIAGYWSTFRAVLHIAYRDHKIKETPNGFLDRIDTIPTEKEHLSQPELVKLANTDCKEPVLKKAFLFSCLTGLRKSDIKQLTWDI